MSSLSLTDEECGIAREIQPRAAALRLLVEANLGAAIRLEVLATFLRAGRGQPNMLYALALIDEAYEALTGAPMAEDRDTLDRELIEEFRAIAVQRLGDG